MSRLPKLRQSRADLLRHIGAIEEMRRGSVTRQFVKVKRPDSGDSTFVGPYPLLTSKKNGRTVGRRLHDPNEVLKIEQQVENYHAFRRLCSQLVDVSEAICEEKERE
jgi:hypothetical protein